MTTRTLRTVGECRAAIESLRQAGDTISFVPTMGHLHAGHVALVRRAREMADRTIVSIFVNPLQFGEERDFETYPRDLDRDLGVCDEEGVDMVFAPGTAEMFPDTGTTRIHVGRLGEVLEGAARPGHFDGVATVVSKLYNIVQPDVVVFGQKDAQQVAVIRKVMEDLAFPIDLEVVSTVREPDGLACSSRNVRLSSTERERAVALYTALCAARDLAAPGHHTIDDLETAMRAPLDRADAEVDYATVVDRSTFDRETSISPASLAVVAARIGTTRLIDNMEIGPDG